MSIRSFISTTSKITKDSLSELNQHDPLVLSSSVAFFTLFSLPPILILVTNIMGTIFHEKLISGELNKKISEIFGESSAQMISKIIVNMGNLGESLSFTILGSVFLIFVGTTTFTIIHKALNQIWQVKEKPKSNFLWIIRERVISFVIILCSGILFVATFLIDAFITFLNEYFEETLPSLFSYPIVALNQITSVIIVTAWFAIIFKFLPNIRIPGKAIFVGSVVTGILFSIGKYLLGAILINSNISNIYGAAGSIVLILLFLFYSAMILFFGAAFTKAYTKYFEYDILPKNHSVIYEINEIESVN